MAECLCSRNWTEESYEWKRKKQQNGGILWGFIYKFRIQNSSRSLAILYNQARPQVEVVGHQPATKPSIYCLSCLQSFRGPEPSRIIIKETWESSCSNWCEQKQNSPPKIRQSLGRPEEEGEEELYEPERSGISWKHHPQNLLTRIHGICRS